MAPALSSSYPACTALTTDTLLCDAAEMVSPSPSRPHAPVLELCSFDHVYNYHNSSLLFYTPAHGDATCRPDVATVVKTALRELLDFYPAAAGRLRLSPCGRRQETACNDAGVEFVSARARMALSDLGDVSLCHPSLDLLLPAARFVKEQRHDEALVAIQVTSFECGGFVLAISVHHAYVDAVSRATFLKNLASIVRGEGISVVPDTASRRERMKAPLVLPSPTPVKHPLILKREDKGRSSLPYLPPRSFGPVTRICFSSQALEDLRQAVLSSAGLNCLSACSRYQALAALLWKARATSLHAELVELPEYHEGMELPVRIPVNLRGKAMHDLPPEYVGNGVYPVVLSASVKQLCESALHELVCKVQMGIRAVTQEGLEDLLAYLEAGEGPVGSSTDPAIFGLSSLINLPFYDTDLGWGRPVYVGMPSMLKTDRIFVLDGGAGGRWNVVAVFRSGREREEFLDTISAHTSVSL